MLNMSKQNNDKEYTIIIGCGRLEIFIVIMDLHLVLQE